jgi:hypothetical protein
MSVPAYIDGDFTAAIAVSSPEWHHPFAGVADAQDRYSNTIPGYVFSQDYIAWTGSHTPLAMGTLHPIWTKHGLVSEEKTQDLGGGVAKWKRIYAAVPKSRTEGTSLAYQFPGYLLSYTTGGVHTYVTARLATTFLSNCTLTYDYFVIGTSGGGALTADYSTFQSIPTFLHQRWTYNVTNGLVVIGLAEMNPAQLWDAGSNQNVAGATNPSATTYLAWQSAGTLFDAEDSCISRWMGPIFQRVRKQIPAL